MQRWHLTTGLAATTVLAALVIPNLPGLLAGGAVAKAPVSPPTPVPVAPIGPREHDGLLELTAELDQAALLRGAGQDRYMVVEVAAPELPGDVRRAVHLSLVMDTSGSMAGRGKITQARLAAKELAGLLGPEDTLSLVTFSDRSQVALSAGPVRDPARTLRLIDGISPGGGTNLHAGLVDGLAQLQQVRAEGVKRVVLLSDGIANLGVTDPDALARLSGSMVGEGISVSALGLGLEYNEDLLAAMSDAGGGTYRFVDRPGQLSALFTEELRQMTAVVGREVTVSVDLPEGVRLQEVYGYDAALRADGYSVFLGDVHGGETRKIVARVAIDDAVDGTTMDVADVALRYSDADSGLASVERAHVAATLTAQAAVARRSVNKTAKRKAVRAHSAKLLDEGARAWEKGDLASNQRRLEEAEEMLRFAGSSLGDADLVSEASGYASQREAFQAAPMASEDGAYQVKKAKEVSRASSR